jgi:transaldolase
MRVEPLTIKLFADGADIDRMRVLAQQDWVAGFTTNPTLMNKAGVHDYRAFAREVLSFVTDRPISFEVFADDFAAMESQAHTIAGWADNVYVKIPITNTQGASAAPLIEKLSRDGVRLNITAIFTLDQVRSVEGSLDANTPAIVSVFAGRIADAGYDPVPVMRESATILAGKPQAELLWASPREVLNVVQAQESGCHIITATPDILAKLKSLGRDLDQFSLETVKMFYDDAQAAGFTI